MSTQKQRKGATAGQNKALDKMDAAINPAHYKSGGMECIEAIRAQLGDTYPGYLRGNLIKYVWRYKNKNGIEDLKKARWYLEALINWEENNDCG